MLRLMCFATFLLLTTTDRIAAQKVDRGHRNAAAAMVVPIRPLQEEVTYKPKVYEIHSQIAPHIGDGRFQYYVETSDGLRAEQIGYVENKPRDSQVHEGAYTTFDETGKVVQVNYIADKDGFRVSGDSLPTPPPIPLDHVKAREDILRQQQEIRNQHLGNFKAAHAAYGRHY